MLVALAGGAGFDSHAYWLTHAGIDYSLQPGEPNAYLYSPAFAQLLRPLTALPWPVFAAAWFAAAAGAYLWLTRGLAPHWRVVVLALCLGDLVYGNVWWLCAIALSVGLRRPALWAIPLLLKITPAVGVVWFAARREWRSLGVVVAVAAAVVAASACLDPQAWSAWIVFLRRQRSADAGAPLRLAAGLALAVFAARTDRPQLLPAALWLASPVFSINGFAVAAAVPRLLAGRSVLRSAGARDFVPAGPEDARQPQCACGGHGRPCRHVEHPSSRGNRRVVHPLRRRAPDRQRGLLRPLPLGRPLRGRGRPRGDREVPPPLGALRRLVCRPRPGAVRP